MTSPENEYVVTLDVDGAHASEYIKAPDLEEVLEATKRRISELGQPAFEIRFGFPIPEEKRISSVCRSYVYVSSKEGETIDDLKIKFEAEVGK